MADGATELERALVRAVHEREPGGRRFVKLDRVVAAAARFVDRFTPALSNSLVIEVADWTDDDYAFYEQCVVAIRTERFLEGQGNFGRPRDDDEYPTLNVNYPELDDDWPPAHPRVLECRLTDRGRALLAEADS